jgi:hypothetical protein
MQNNHPANRISTDIRRKYMADYMAKKRTQVDENGNVIRRKKHTTEEKREQTKLHQSFKKGSVMLLNFVILCIVFIKKPYKM